LFAVWIPTNGYDGHGNLALLQNAMTEFNLSARAYDRILKVSRTIADLERSDLRQVLKCGEKRSDPLG
jgi:predicted ATPase with chaperone activity